jgi:Holliday junction resolvasome RuvABC endonuclease subunit
MSLQVADISPPNGIRGAARLVSLESQLQAAISDMLKPYSDPVVQACVEGYSYGSVGTLAQLGEWGGLIRRVLYLRGIRFATVPPSTLKKHTTGRGDAKKPDMRRPIDLRLAAEWASLPPDASDDVVDAVALALILRDGSEKLEWDAVKR